jgi:hypothetical protein
VGAGADTDWAGGSARRRAAALRFAAALAGAIEVKREILAAYAMDHQLEPEEIQMGLVCAQAALYNIMMCESGGDPHATEAPGGNGGPLGHYGLFEFDIPTWESVGGHGDPRDASPEEQWMRAYLLYRQRGFQPWECADASHLGYA